jgi:bacteriocin biosynthesis cyclodehydratase domain-containing protein
VTSQLRFAERFVILRETSEEYWILSAFESVRVRAEYGMAGLLDRVLPLLKSGLCEDELHSAVGEAAAEQEQLDRLLAELARRGLVERIEPSSNSRHVVPDEALAAQERYLANFLPFQDQRPEMGNLPRPSGAEISARLAKAKTLLIGDGYLADRTAAQLLRAGMQKTSRFVVGPTSCGEQQEQLAAALDEADIAVVCLDLRRVSLLRAVNGACLERKVPWISAHTVGSRSEVGPTVVPGDTACFACYEKRRESNDDGYQEEAERAERLALQGLDTGRLAVEAADGILAAEVLKLAGGFSRPMTYGSVFFLDLITLESGLHPVLKIPRCRICGTPARNQPTTSVWPFS